MVAYHAGMVRAFVAIELSEEIKEGLRDAQVHLGDCNARLKMVDPTLAHITLKFLGEVEPERIEQVEEALRGVRGAPFTLTVGGVEGSNRRRPRVVWCTVADGGETARLAAAVEKALEPLGFEREKRQFTPHITLARVREFDPSLLEVIEDLATAKPGACEVRAIILKKSTLTRTGPIYETLMEVSLGEK
ncbi:RNA 2',3'-cyclic phosphodiesterase [Methanofollis aquaemaris]|nr:RNA 2',3'-cyclic phosphodiesterase [Methanofollis aquaemaris]